MLRPRKTVLDISQFLHCLQNVVCKSKKCDFDFFQQQYANEIISGILKGLCVKSTYAQDMLRTILKYQMTCNNCYEVCRTKSQL